MQGHCRRFDIEGATADATHKVVDFLLERLVFGDRQYLFVYLRVFLFIDFDALLRIIE